VGLSAFTKPSISVEQQVELLQTRGLIIQDAERAKSYLEVISFFRLSAYMRRFQQASDSKHNFKAGAEFKQVVSLYAFDRELRLLVMDAIERIEVAVRSMINNVMGPKYQQENDPHSGSHWYLNRSHFKQVYDHERLINSIRDKVEKERTSLDKENTKIERARHDDSKKAMLKDMKQRENYCRYYGNNYSQPALPPGWAAIEELTLGDISHIYKGLARDADRKAIAKRFDAPQDKLESWLHTLTFVRNCCAHHARLWNRELPIAPKLMRDNSWQLPSVLPGTHIQPPRRLAAVLLLLSYLMKQVSPDSKWMNKVIALIKRYDEVPVKNMGLPENWEEFELFQEVCS
jgi:abortive infection bacteriophage resistance protein